MFFVFVSMRGFLAYRDFCVFCLFMCIPIQRDNVDIPLTDISSSLHDCRSKPPLVRVTVKLRVSVFAQGPGKTVSFWSLFHLSHLTQSNTQASLYCWDIKPRRGTVFTQRETESEIKEFCCTLFTAIVPTYGACNKFSPSRLEELNK